MAFSIRLSNRSSPSQSFPSPLFLFAVKLCSRLSFRSTGKGTRESPVHKRVLCRLFLLTCPGPILRLGPDYRSLCHWTQFIIVPLKTQFVHYIVKWNTFFFIADKMSYNAFQLLAFRCDLRRNPTPTYCFSFVPSTRYVFKFFNIASMYYIFLRTIIPLGGVTKINPPAFDKFKFVTLSGQIIKLINVLKAPKWLKSSGVHEIL